MSSYSLKPALYRDLLLYRVIGAARERGTIIVGIHVRRSDYRQWSNGKFYYSDDIYIRVKREMGALVHQVFQAPSLFVVFSDEVVAIEPSEDLVLSAHQWYEDHALMGLCDYVIGPPSTFSIWSCFIGGAKLLHLHRGDQPVALDAFKNIHAA